MDRAVVAALVNGGGIHVDIITNKGTVHGVVWCGVRVETGTVWRGKQAYQAVQRHHADAWKTTLAAIHSVGSWSSNEAELTLENKNVRFAFKKIDERAERRVWHGSGSS